MAGRSSRSYPPRMENGTVSFFEMTLDRSEGLSFTRLCYDRSRATRSPIPACFSRETLGETLIGFGFYFVGKTESGRLSLTGKIKPVLFMPKRVAHIHSNCCSRIKSIPRKSKGWAR